MPAAIVETLGALTQADLAACDRSALADLVGASTRVRGWLDAFDARVATAAGRLTSAGACEPAATLLADGGRRSARDARVAAERGAVCEAMPSLHQALSEGQVSAGHADAIARVAGQLDATARATLVELAPALVASAVTTPVETFERDVRDLGRLLSRDDGARQSERLRRQRSLRRWMDCHGLCHTHVVLDPESDARLSAALDGAVAAERAAAGGPDSRTFEQMRADAFVNLVTSARSSGRRPSEISVLVDLDTLRSGLHARSVCETGDGQPLPPAAVRRLACDGDIVPIVLDGDGVTLDVGRTRRVATADQRRALRAMYRTCGHPDCTVRFADCEIHHAVEWNRSRGPTDMANLLPLCSAHHHQVHEGGWHLALRPDRTITLRRPDGAVHHDASTVDVTPTRRAHQDLLDHIRNAVARATARAPAA